MKAEHTLEAKITEHGNYLMYRGVVQIGRVVLQRSPEGDYWLSVVHSCSTRPSIKRYQMPEEAAYARWGADGRNAIRTAMRKARGETEQSTAA